jgi:very-short-patch-repair endonuclease
LVNTLVAGTEADQYFPDHKLVVEIDGPGFHRLRDDDARKTVIWRAAGLTVRRVSSDDVFDHPERYLALVPPRRRRTRAETVGRTSIAGPSGG